MNKNNNQFFFIIFPLIKYRNIFEKKSKILKYRGYKPVMDFIKFRFDKLKVL